MKNRFPSHEFDCINKNRFSHLKYKFLSYNWKLVEYTYIEVATFYTYKCIQIHTQIFIRETYLKRIKYYAVIRQPRINKQLTLHLEKEKFGYYDQYVF